MNHLVTVAPVRRRPCGRRLLSLFLLLLAGLGLGPIACSPGKAKEAPPKKAPPPALVQTAKATVQDVPLVLAAFGTMEASESVTVKPLISAELTRVAFREGQEVKMGDPLFELDPRTYQAELNKAQAALARDQVVLDTARRDYTRYAQLVKEGIVTQEQAEGYRTKAETAAAELSADQAAVANARAQLSYCTITAPISGRLGSLLVDRGNVVKANETNMVTINRLTPITVSFTLPEKELPRVKERLAQGGMELAAEVPGGQEGDTEQGTVLFLDNSVDTATGTIRLKGSFANQGHRLWPGQFVTLSLTLDLRPHSVTVPSQAIMTGQGGQFVFVVKDDLSAEVRPITTGAVYRDRTVVDSGLAAGEQVVIDGQMRVVPGAKVELSPGGQQPAEQGATSR